MNEVAEAFPLLPFWDDVTSGQPRLRASPEDEYQSLTNL